MVGSRICKAVTRFCIFCVEEAFCLDKSEKMCYNSRIIGEWANYAYAADVTAALYNKNVKAPEPDIGRGLTYP